MHEQQTVEDHLIDNPSRSFLPTFEYPTSLAFIEAITIAPCFFLQSTQSVGDRCAVHRASVLSSIPSRCLLFHLAVFLVACDFVSPISCSSACDYWILSLSI
jgi:hypothetical protein